MYLDTYLEMMPGKKVALRIYREQRNGSRASVGRNELIFRVPKGLPPLEEARMIDKLKAWAIQTFKQKPAAFAHLIPKSLDALSTLVVMDTLYKIELSFSKTQLRHFGCLVPEENLVRLELVEGTPLNYANKAVQNLLSKLFSDWYLQLVQNRVHELNSNHFQRPVKAVKLRLTQSRWGSCSNSGNINLSSRLLLAPAKVRDAVIIHELAHLLEMNHGDRFWQLVYQAMPDYQEQDHFLQTQGYKLHFWPDSSS